MLTRKCVYRQHLLITQASELMPSAAYLKAKLSRDGVLLFSKYPIIENLSFRGHHTILSKILKRGHGLQQSHVNRQFKATRSLGKCESSIHPGVHSQGRPHLKRKNYGMNKVIRVRRAPTSTRKKILQKLLENILKSLRLNQKPPMS